MKNSSHKRPTTAVQLSADTLVDNWNLPRSGILRPLDSAQATPALNDREQDLLSTASRKISQFNEYVGIVYLKTDQAIKLWNLSLWHTSSKRDIESGPALHQAAQVLDEVKFIQRKSRGTSKVFEAKMEVLVQGMHKKLAAVLKYVCERRDTFLDKHMGIVKWLGRLIEIVLSLADRLLSLFSSSWLVGTVSLRKLACAR